MIVYIKNMVCVRCKMAVQSVLDSLGIRYVHIELGSAHLADVLPAPQLKILDAALKHYQLELMDDKKKILAEQVKVLIIDLFHSDTNLYDKLSDYLSKSLFYDYTYLSNMFSETEGTTIERFYIESRVERAKELIKYEEMTVTEIAYQLNYSSVSHFCLQFKKVTGQTPSQFKKLCGTPGFAWKNDQ